MPNPDGSPKKGEPGYIEPNSGLLSVGTPGPAVTPGYTPSAAAATRATSTPYDPSKFAVTPEQTVAGQVDKLVKEDSPLMQAARTRANADAQARGLLFSSTAVGAGQGAVLDRALPIASQDASTYNKAMTDTIQAENTAKQFSAGSATDVSKSNAGLLTQTALANAESANKAKSEAASGFLQSSLQYVDNQTKTALATLDAQNRQLLQASGNLQQMFQEVVKNIAGIAVDNTLSKGAKNKATETQMNLLRQALLASGGIASTVPAAVTNLDLGQYFQPAAAPTPTPAQAATPNPIGGLFNNIANVIRGTAVAP